MSATLQPTIFQKYYKEVGRYIEPIDIQKYTIPIINCEAGNKKVELFFLNQIKEILDLDINQVSKNNKDKISLIC